MRFVRASALQVIVLLTLSVLLSACAGGGAAPTLSPVPATTAPAAASPTPATPTRVIVALPQAPAEPTAPTWPPPPRPPAPPTAGSGATPVDTYRVVQTYPHDPTAFTQGLIFVDGALYEGTGLNGQSSLRRVELETGRVLQQRDLAPEYFGEGITLFGDRIFQLTWQSHVGFVYDRTSFAPVGTFSYPTEGWGLTHDGRRLIMSDGTATLRFLDPATLRETGSVEVRDEHGPVLRLNELEYVEGEILANVWQTDRIARIDPATGRVTGWIDLTGLKPATDRPIDVLNGIAYDPATKRLFVTGKYWPSLFEIQVVPAP